MQTKNANIHSENEPGLLLLSSLDNVKIIKIPLKAGETMLLDGRPVAVRADLPLGCKIAARPILAGEKIIKFGVPIGSATQSIALGELVHTHNLKSDYLSARMPDEQ
jgi:altronate dehydratase small subunit